MCAVASRTSRPDLGEYMVTARHAHAVTVFDGGPPVGLSAPRTDHGEPCTWSARLFDVTAKRQESRAEEHTPELQSQSKLVCRLLLQKNRPTTNTRTAGEPQRGEVWVRKTEKREADEP